MVSRNLRSPHSAVVLHLFLAVYVLAGSAWAQCEPHWAQGLFPRNGHTIWPSALCVYDDGTGPALYAGGDFYDAGDVGANHIARWRNGMWEAVGAGPSGYVYCMCVYDDGFGPAIYVGGWFSRAGGITAKSIARWRNGAWETLEGGVSGGSLRSEVYALCVYDDGTGLALYVGGNFSKAGGIGANGLARWKNGRWEAISEKPRYASTRCLCVYDDGSGPALCMTGSGDLHKWQHGIWQSFPTDKENYFSCLCVYDDGTGPALYAADYNGNVGGVYGCYVVRWRDGDWQPVGNPLGQSGSEVHALAVFDDGSGPALYACGYFRGTFLHRDNVVARLRNGVWEPLGDEISGEAKCLCVHDDGAGPALYVGAVSTVGGKHSGGIAKCSKGKWDTLADGMGGVWYPDVRSMCVHDDGTGPGLYAGGFFFTAGGVDAKYIARWKNGNWQPLPGGIDGPYYSSVACLCSYDDGTGPVLHAGGSFADSAGVAGDYVARWRSGTWDIVGKMDLPVNCLCAYDDGTGPALYAGCGDYDPFTDEHSGTIARWKNGAWEPVGDKTAAPVLSLCIHNDGTGSALYAAGGYCSYYGGICGECPLGVAEENVSIGYVSRWNGQTWQPVGADLDAPVDSLCVYDDGTGPALYAGAGYYSDWGIGTRNYVVKWTDGRWQLLGNEMTGPVYSLCVFDDGTGPALYAGGLFRAWGGTSATSVARWRNGTWQDMGTGMNGGVNCLSVYDDGAGPALFAGGDFATVGAFASPGVARWGCEPQPTSATGSIRLLQNASLVTLSGQVSTAAFGNTFYAETRDRYSGIRVDLPGHAIARDRQINVTGRVRTDKSGERYVHGFTAADVGPLFLEPLAMNLDVLGGGTFGFQDGVWGWIRTIDGAGKPVRTWGRECGLNNIGLLVRCSGRFASGDSTSFRLTDGDENVLVTIPSGVIINPDWQHITVTGISACTVGASGLERLIRVRCQGDIVEHR